jgi:YD repeat-containing protein
VERGTVDGTSDGDWAAFGALEAVESSYDTLGRAVTTRLTSGGTTYVLSQTSYDAKGRTECTAQRMNPSAFGSLPSSACSLGTQGSFGPDRIVKTIYDSADQVTQVKSALGTPDEANEVTTTYRANGKAETVRDAENNRTSYEYDGHDRLSRTLYPVATKGAGTSNSNDYEQLGYDAASNVTSFRNRANQTISFGYDAIGRLGTKQAQGEMTVTYAYDLLGRMTSASRAGHVVGFTYDALGRKLTEAQPLGTVSSAYDIAGRRTRITHPDGFFVTQEYLVTGEMSAIRQEGGGFVIASFGYDDLGRRISLTGGNGAVTSYSYDPVSRLSQLTHDLRGTDADATFSYSYNPASQIVSKNRSSIDIYAWGAHGNGTTASPANGLNQLTSHGGGAVTYDAKGNVTYDPTIGYGYDYTAENLVRWVNAPGWTGYIIYDPLMRLYEAGANNWTTAVYDGDHRIAEYYNDGEQMRRVVYGPGVDEPLVETDFYFGTRTDLHADERGSVVIGSDGYAQLATIGRYDENGQTQTFASRFGYIGRPYETLTFRGPARCSASGSCRAATAAARRGRPLPRRQGSLCSAGRGSGRRSRRR